MLSSLLLPLFLKVLIAIIVTFNSARPHTTTYPYAAVRPGIPQQYLMAACVRAESSKVAAVQKQTTAAGAAADADVDEEWWTRHARTHLKINPYAYLKYYHNIR